MRLETLMHEKDATITKLAQLCMDTVKSQNSKPREEIMNPEGDMHNSEVADDREMDLYNLQRDVLGEKLRSLDQQQCEGNGNYVEPTGPVCNDAPREDDADKEVIRKAAQAVAALNDEKLKRVRKELGLDVKEDENEACTVQKMGDVLMREPDEAHDVGTSSSEEMQEYD